MNTIRSFVPPSSTISRNKKFKSVNRDRIIFAQGYSTFSEALMNDKLSVNDSEDESEMVSVLPKTNNFIASESRKPSSFGIRRSKQTAITTDTLSKTIVPHLKSLAKPTSKNVYSQSNTPR